MTRSHLAPLALLALAGCQSDPWTLDIKTDDLEFRTKEPYPDNLWSFRRTLRSFQALRDIYGIEDVDTPIVIEYEPEEIRAETFRVVSDADEADAQGDAGPSGDDPTELFLQRVLLSYELSHLLFAVAFPDQRYVPWLREGVATYLLHGRLRSDPLEFEPPDFARFADLTREVAAGKVPEPGTVFEAPYEEFLGGRSAELRYRAALVVGHYLSSREDLSLRQAIEGLIQLEPQRLRQLEVEALERAKEAAATPS